MSLLMCILNLVMAKDWIFKIIKIHMEIHAVIAEAICIYSQWSGCNS